MLDFNRVWLKKNQQLRAKSKKFKDIGIHSYRIYSMPLQKNLQLKVTARKKVLSPVPSVKTPKIGFAYGGFNKTSGLDQTFLFNYSKDGALKKMPESPVSKIRWAERHFSCYQKSHVRAKSIQDNYLGTKRKTSLLNTCEISLQTYN